MLLFTFSFLHSFRHSSPNTSAYHGKAWYDTVYPICWGFQNIVLDLRLLTSWINLS